MLNDLIFPINLTDISFTVISLDETTLYPGFAALLPIVGTFLIIGAGPHAWLNQKILAHPYLVAIGLISFPLYLWHWPLLSFARILNAGLPGWEVRVVLIIISFVLATLTYLWLEKPIRKKSNKAAVPLLIIMISIAIYCSYTRNKKINTLLAKNPEVHKVAAAVGDWDFPGPILNEFIYKDFSFYEQGEGNDSILFFGDSNVQQYAPRITKLLSENPKIPKKVIFATKSGCLPIPNIYAKNKNTKCSDFVKAVLAYVEQTNVATIVIGAQWLGYFDSNSYYYKENKKQFPLSNSIGREKAFLAFDLMVKEFRVKNKKVYIILNIPIGPEFDPTNMVKRNVYLRKLTITNWQDKVLDNGSNSISQRFEHMAIKYSLMLLDPKTDLCVHNKCARITKEGNPIYKDENHLRPFYVREYMTFLDKILHP